jgi:hypothetical protein
MKDNRKTFNRGETPPISPHKNPVKEAGTLLIRSLKITEKFSG